MCSVCSVYACSVCVCVWVGVRVKSNLFVCNRRVVCLCVCFVQVFVDFRGAKMPQCTLLVLGVDFLRQHKTVRFQAPLSSLPFSGWLVGCPGSGPPGPNFEIYLGALAKKSFDIKA